MFQAAISCMKIVIMFLKWPMIIGFGFVLLFVVDVSFWYVVGLCKGQRVDRGSVRKLPRRSAFLRIFYDAPRRYVQDIFNQKPDFFKPQGLVIFTGRQGNGKTSSAIQYALDLHDTYPKAKIISNTKVNFSDADLRHWRQLVSYKNGYEGVVVIMDELQNWFSSNQSRNFPPEMLSVITQNRKNRRVILGTAQNFYLLAKAIRSQTTEVRQCFTLAGVLTVVIRREPVVDNDGEVKEMKYRGMYFYVHSDRLRGSYDTWATVEALSKAGFSQNPFLQPQPSGSSNS